MVRTAVRLYDAHVDRHGPEARLRQATGSAEHDYAAALHNEQAVMLFATALVQSRSAATALCYCSVLRTHSAACFDIPFPCSSTRWKRFVRSIKRQHTGTRRSSDALRGYHLRRAFHNRGAPSSVAQVNDWAAVSAGWQMLARPAELISLTGPCCFG